MTPKGIAISEPLLSQGLHTHRGFLPRRTIPMRPQGRDGDGLIFILEGHCRYTFLDGRRFTVEKNDILYLANDARYSMDVDCDRYEFFVVNFRFVSSDPYQSAVYHPRDKEGAKQLFSRLCAHPDFHAPRAAAEGLSLFYRVLAMAIESTEASYISGKAKATAVRAAETIHAECHRPDLSVAELSAAADMSEVHFRRLFARNFGISPARYIMRARVDRAKALMADGTYSLSDIAEQSGFSSAPYFYRVFREITGTTPAAYRREFLNHPL